MSKKVKQEIEILDVDDSLDEVSNVKEKKSSEKKKRKFKKISKFTILILLLDIIVINNNKFKAFWIPTAMTTKSHKYLAYTLYDPDTVNKVMSENYIETNNEEINLNDIVIGNNTKTHYT